MKRIVRLKIIKTAKPSRNKIKKYLKLLTSLTRFDYINKQKIQCLPNPLAMTHLFSHTKFTKSV